MGERRKLTIIPSADAGFGSPQNEIAGAVEITGAP
jgi:hypothetical protein